MASTYTPNLGLEKQADGENSSTWGQKVNVVFDLLEDAITGVGSISMTSDANKTLTDTDGAVDESRSAILEFTSTLSLTATRSIIVPTSGKIYVIKNGTTGSQSLTITTVSGTGVTVANGDVRIVYCDGTNILEAGATAQTASEIKTLLENGIDSIHYVDGSIDNEHIADDAIDSEHYVDGSVDAAHLSATLGDLRRGVTHIGRDANDHIQIDTDMIRFYIDGVNVMSCDASGNIIAKGNVTAYGTPA